MQYEEAIKVWGAKRLCEANPKAKFDVRYVHVDFEIDEGFACCGGSDPYCYCSFAESPSMKVVIVAGKHRHEISSYEFDFPSILKEILEAADGTITE